MASVNKVTLIGNMGRDPELRYSPSGAAVCNTSIATTRSWKNRDTGEKQEETEWHRVVFYDKLAEIVGEYLKKGRPVYIEGRLRTRKWQDKEGRDCYTTEVIADQMQMLGSRDDGGGGENEAAARQRNTGSDGRQRAPAPAPAPRPQPQRQAAPSGGGGPPAGFDDMDDDIPFVSADFALEQQTSIERRMRRYDCR